MFLRFSPIFFSLLLLLLLLLSPPLPSSAQRQQQTTFSSFSISNSPWRPTQNRILLSSNSTFAAGFRPLHKSPNLYTFSIWYHNISRTTVVWSANENFPVYQSATLTITSSGELRLSRSSTGENLWPNRPSSNTTINNTQLILRENGDLVYGDWESFFHPTHTILPNQTINGTTLASRNGKFRFLNSTHLVFGQNDSYWTAPNGNRFMKLSDDGQVEQETGTSFILADFREAALRRLTLGKDGNLRIYSFDRSSGRWVVVWQAIQELCRIHGTCGQNSLCMPKDSNSTMCVCPPGFRRGVGDDEEGCERKIPISRPENTKFLRLDYVDFSGRQNTTLVSRNISSCEARCLGDPDCHAFRFNYDGSGNCTLQLGDLINGYWSPATESAIFIRVDGSETDRPNFTGMTDVLETTCPVRISLPLPPDESNTTTRNIVIICTLFAAELISGAVFFWAFLKKYIKYRDMAQTLGLEFLPAGGPKRFTLSELKIATGNFSNLIGRGGFGDVYKGELTDGRIVAVKRLKNVTGGDPEFWAEVTIIARMHHLNLVRLWGFCTEKGQRILVYEYVPNGSLAKYLFQRVPDKEDGETPTPVLDWNIRYRIALGVARAIAYLHEECLEWVLHRDIKPENILLGDDFCPKISDFGLAKLEKKEDMVKRSRIQGTRGYMAPEWIRTDQITPKADVYSFGMVLLEMVTGVRNNQMPALEVNSEDWYFPGWAFEKVIGEMRVEEILDERIKGEYDNKLHFDAVNRMVKTAMWCLQERIETRPSMGKVAKMLEGTVEIMEPPKPTIFYLGGG